MSELPMPPRTKAMLDRLEGMISLELGEDAFWTLVFVYEGKTAVISPTVLGLSREHVATALKRTIILLEGGEI